MKSLDKNGNIIYSVYRVTLGNNNRYIGMTSSKVEHRVKNGLKYNYNIIVRNEYNKYDLDKIETLYTTNIKSQAEALEISTIYIENTLRVGYGGLNQNGLNLQKGGSHSGGFKYENNPTAKLTQSEVDIIKTRLINGDPQPEIADQFGVSKSTISNINIRNTWDNTGLITPINPNYLSKSKETINKMSKSKSGDKNPMFGIKHTEDYKKKMSKSLKGKNTNNSDDLKINCIILGLLKFRRQFICDLKRKKYQTVTGWIKNRNIGNIDFNECKQIALFLNNHPCNQAFLLKTDY